MIGSQVARWGAVALGGLLLAGTPAARGACVPSDTVVHAGLFASANNIPLGTEFDVYLQVTGAGQCFNGFDARIDWDRNAMTLLQLSPLSQQEGTLMKSACSNRFHVFTPDADSAADLTDVLLCDGTFVSGPGQAYRLRFRAGNTQQVTYVRLRSLQFYNAGLYIGSPGRTDALVGIGVSVGVVEPPAARLALRVAPNPARGAFQIVLEADRPGVQRLLVRDVQGRTVGRLAGGWFPAGSRVLTWNGQDGTGGRLAPGVYLVTLEAAGTTTSTRVTLLR